MNKIEPKASIPSRFFVAPIDLNKPEEGKATTGSLDLRFDQTDGHTNLKQSGEGSPCQPQPIIKNMKLSTFNQLNNLNEGAPKKKSKCKFSFFYVYTALILGLTLMVSISPSTAAYIVEEIVKFCKLTATVPEPARSLVYLGVFYCHQFLGIPLQTVSVMLVTFSLRKFWHGYLLACIANVTSSAIFFVLFKKCLRKAMEKRHKDNMFVNIIKEESQKHPIRVSFVFRFMNIPGLYKNIGLGISEHISFFWFIIPALVEAIISNAFICFLGSVMEHGIDVLDPKTIASKASHTKILFSVSYVLLAVQFLCIGVGVLFMLLKIKKMRQLKTDMKIKKWRENMADKGYIHDFEAKKDTKRGAENSHQNAIEIFEQNHTIDEDEETPSMMTPEKNASQQFQHVGLKPELDRQSSSTDVQSKLSTDLFQESKVQTEPLKQDERFS